MTAIATEHNLRRNKKPTWKLRAEFCQQLTDGCLALIPELCGIDLYSYQTEMADRILFDLLYGDAEEITVEASRQSGKSETLACVVTIVMVVFPKLAALYPHDPHISKFKRGAMVGVFGPIDFQAENIFSRVSMRLTSQQAEDFLSDPEIDDEARTAGKMIIMRKSNSFCRMQTAHPKAKIESSTYHLVIIDEAQDADTETVRRRISPMTTATAGTIVKVGTPTTHISDYYEAIQRNTLRGPTHGKKNHFRYDWHHAARANPYYAKSIEREKRKLGEDSDEFKMAYLLIWMLDRGMFITEETILELADTSMPMIGHYTDTPVVAGLDVARTSDSTVLTILWVDWNDQDEFGFFNHRVLSWLELHGENWESQYKQIVDFVRHYRVSAMGVDAQGMGAPAAERLQILLPDIDVQALPMNQIDQGERWTHLMQLIQRRRIGWPGHRKTRRTLCWKRFKQQMASVEKEYKGKYLTVAAPKNDKNAHDDYVDSLALACAMTMSYAETDTVEQWGQNPFLERRSYGSRV